jgi:hypothetical protein
VVFPVDRRLVESEFRLNGDPVTRFSAEADSDRPDDLRALLRAATRRTGGAADVEDYELVVRDADRPARVFVDLG